MNLLKRTEIHKCDKCEHTHEYEAGLFTWNEIKDKLGFEVKIVPNLDD